MNRSGENKIEREMYLAGPEPHLDFGAGSFHCVNTTPSRIEIRTIGVWFTRGDTAASIEICMPVTVCQLVRPSSISFGQSQSQRKGEIVYPVWSRPGAMVQLAVVWSAILFGLTLLTPSTMSISPWAERNKHNEPTKASVRMGKHVSLLGQFTSSVIHKAGQVLKH